MTHFDQTLNKIYFGSTDKLIDWTAEKLDQAKIIDKIRLMLKNYLELDNVSFLFGSGTSIHLGAASIRNFPLEVERYIVEKKLENELYTNIKELQAKLVQGKSDKEEFKDSRGWEFVVDESMVRDNESKELALEYEKVLNYLIAKDFVLNENKSLERKDKIGELIIAIKEGLFQVCDLENRKVSQTVIDNKKKSKFEKSKEQGLLLETRSKYIFHEKFIKALLQRPLNLRRANIFYS